METTLMSPFSQGGFRGIINAFLFRLSLFQSSQFIIVAPGTGGAGKGPGGWPPGAKWFIFNI